MNEREALLRAVCENPDDTPRLVLADWLQENGDEHDRTHAEFIRLQCALARGQLAGVQKVEGLQRVLELLSANDEQWRASVPTVAGASVCGNYDRGFLATVQVDHWDMFRLSAEELFRSVPVAWLVITELENPGVLADLPFLKRLSQLSIGVRRPSTESLMQFATAANLHSLQRVHVCAPRLSEEQERLLAKRFGTRLTRSATLQG